MKKDGGRTGRRPSRRVVAKALPGDEALRLLLMKRTSESGGSAETYAQAAAMAERGIRAPYINELTGIPLEFCRRLVRETCPDVITGRFQDNVARLVCDVDRHSKVSSFLVMLEDLLQNSADKMFNATLFLGAISRYEILNYNDNTSPPYNLYYVAARKLLVSGTVRMCDCASCGDRYMTITEDEFNETYFQAGDCPQCRTVLRVANWQGDDLEGCNLARVSSKIHDKKTAVLAYGTILGQGWSR